MANWGLKCKRCGVIFTHSRIGETLTDYFVPLKPELPTEGLELECPHCKTKSIYLRNDLTYKEV
jgi:DNA-directed RNA polymerase subunit RPC12/RpoP